MKLTVKIMAIVFLCVQSVSATEAEERELVPVGSGPKRGISLPASFGPSVQPTRKRTTSCSFSAPVIVGFKPGLSSGEMRVEQEKQAAKREEEKAEKERLAALMLQRVQQHMRKPGVPFYYHAPSVHSVGDRELAKIKAARESEKELWQQQLFEEERRLGTLE